jgi:hypothetical protein
MNGRAGGAEASPARANPQLSFFSRAPAQSIKMVDATAAGQAEDGRVKERQHAHEAWGRDGPAAIGSLDGLPAGRRGEVAERPRYIEQREK